MQNQLVGRNPLKRGFMELLVQTVLVIIVLQLLIFLNGDIHHFNIKKQRRVIRFVPILHRIDVLHPGAEIFIGELTQLFNQFLRLRGIDMLTAKHTVNE